MEIKKSECRQCGPKAKVGIRRRCGTLFCKYAGAQHTGL